MLDLYIDIDAHGIFPQTLRTAHRHSLELYVVTKDYLQADTNLHLIVVEDDQVTGGARIAANITRGDICVTADSGLAANCVRRGALALSPRGWQWGADTRDDDATHNTRLWSSSPRDFGQRLERAIASIRAIGDYGITAPRHFSRTGFGTPHQSLMSRAVSG
jgi:uncharacterized protein YaiI (UPF0178 family)